MALITPRAMPWLLAGTLVAIALARALLSQRHPDELPDDPPGSFDKAVAPDATDASDREASNLDLARVDQEPRGLAARLLTDSEGARRNLLAMSIRDAGRDCPEVRSAEPLATSGHAWRAYCGALRLYWIEIDEFGRMSVEPGAYDESDFVPGGSRTITIPQEELQELQPVR